MSPAEFLSIIESSEAALDERIDAAHALVRSGDPRTVAPDRVAIPAGPFASGDPPRTVRLEAYTKSRTPRNRA
jgi:hypothetical protein